MKICINLYLCGSFLPIQEIIKSTVFLSLVNFTYFCPQMRFRVNTECIISLNKTSVLAIVYLSVQIDVKADLVFRCHTNRQ